MQENPFKFGQVVDGPYFITRKEEIKQVTALLNSANNLVMISPRRYGKTSLIEHVVNNLNRPYIKVDLQLVTSPEDLAAQIIKRLSRLFPLEKIKQALNSFQIVPEINLNPLNNEIDLSFDPASSPKPIIEDAINLIEQLSTPQKRMIAVFDEFQEIRRIEKDLDRQLHALMQHHQQVNYVFLGSQESLIRDIFENKKSPFFQFGQLMPLQKIPTLDFFDFLSDRFKPITPEYNRIATSILEISRCHSYYAQQLAFFVYEQLRDPQQPADPVSETVSELIRIHDMHYERLWKTLNTTDMKILIGMSLSELSPLSEAFSHTFHAGATSTIFSSLKRLAENGFIQKSETGYEIDDPFFKRWITQRRNR
ncbi:MAG: ATP-binding protein [Bacteroidales bacterium]|nr:ATP-binding protein [Bacteroidales bacterium]